MIVYGKCKSCKTEIGFSTSAATRVEFTMQEGERKVLNCKNCCINTEFHVDELYAKGSKVAQIGAGLIFLIGSPLIYFLISPVFARSRNHYAIYAIGGFLLLPIFAYAIIKKRDQIRVNAFNRIKLKGRIHNIDF